MFLQRWLRPGPARSAGAQLYAATVAQAREPAIYSQLGAPDTPDGRFEVYTLHVLMVLARLQGQGAPAAHVSQALFDAYLSGLDHGLRELAVGDLAVGKTMRKLGEAFYGRGQKLAQAQAAVDGGELEALLRRTVLGGDENTDAGRLADYVLRIHRALAATPTQRLLDGEINWPSPV
ncbi:MAG TPA: ubiquinol-cytochrome C chaperone family protein [Caulobacteraceae bacterium]|nr:ubiquinol-cytochrome C chaperone family protein [Caulobacteraceae bacterium]